MTPGYDKPLYVLPFDHRASFSKEMFGWEGELGPEQTAEIAAVKRVIFDAARAAVAGGVPKQRAGILVDEQFGAAILRDARREGLITCCPAEKSGQAEFDFEYGADFARHIEEFNPTFCKVLVRYNPEGDKEMNRRQAARLQQLSDCLHRSGRLYMFELLVPAEPAQLQRLGNDKKAYDLQMRPALSLYGQRGRRSGGRLRGVPEDAVKLVPLDAERGCHRRVGRDGPGLVRVHCHQDFLIGEEARPAH